MNQAGICEKQSGYDGLGCCDSACLQECRFYSEMLTGYITDADGYSDELLA